MKINELSISEGTVGSAIKGLFTGAGTKATLAQDIFMKDFYGDALTSLKNGITSGIVSTTKPEPEPASVTEPEAKPVTKQAPSPSLAKRSRMMKSKLKQNRMNESSSYERLNNIFESIVTETATMSISEYMLQWFATYMTGTNWKPYEESIESLCKNIEDAYPRGNWKKAIKQLGRAAYSIPALRQAAGVQNILPQASASNTPVDVQIKKLLSDPRTRDKLVKGLAPYIKK